MEFAAGLTLLQLSGDLRCGCAPRKYCNPVEQQQKIVARGLRDCCIGLQACDVFEQPTPGRNDVMTEGMAGARNSSVRMPEEVNDRVTLPEGEVSPTVAAAEFMIDTGCQVTILATSVFEQMCASDPRIRSRLRPSGRRLISADSSPLMVRGELYMIVVFPGLSCNMVLVVASIGLEGLLVTEALQSCLHRQIYLRTGQLWADGRSTLHLHQQWQAARASVHLKSSLVLSLPVPICSPSGVQPGRRSLIEPQIALTESYGVLVGHTLVDASKWSAMY